MRERDEQDSDSKPSPDHHHPIAIVVSNPESFALCDRESIASSPRLCLRRSISCPVAAQLGAAPRAERAAFLDALPARHPLLLGARTLNPHRPIPPSIPYPHTGELTFPSSSASSGASSPCASFLCSSHIARVPPPDNCERGGDHNPGRCGAIARTNTHIYTHWQRRKILLRRPSMEIFKAEDVPSTAIALLPNPMPVGPSGDNSSTIANTSQPMRPHNNTRFNASFAMVPAHSADHDAPAHGSVAPHTDDIPSLGKGLTFKLIQQLHARPLRVTIWPHDTTESIVSTVRNFFGLGRPTERLSVGVSLEDDRANTLIPSWANFNDGGIVYVRIFERLEPLSPTHDDGPGHPSVGLPESAGALDMAPWAQRQHISGLSYGVSRVRSPSPNDLRGRRSTPTAILGKRSRSPPTKKSHSGSQDGYSSGDSAPASSSSRTKDRSRATDISVENIVEGGRRKLAKFSSAVSTLFGVIAHCAWLVADSSSSPGASSVCPAANARRYIQLVRVAGSRS